MAPAPVSGWQKVQLMDEQPDLKLLTLAEVVARFKGKIGKTKLVEHIIAVPFFADGPTHCKNGNRYLFTDSDIGRIIDSLAAQITNSEPSRRVQQKALPSEERAFERAMAKLSANQKSARRAQPSKRPQSKSKKPE
jgi:hypothetical protein